ncbi:MULTISPECIES: MerR family transcriptional regulator [Pseudomonas]|uniref:MerR family transcriptional regulator n=1 Tax=Serpens gallinarum TaxID=2763075 RepID=A0ABR8TT08_9PSED|nr:MerR family transcriptional regulator [Serpens gallinarum]MBD7978902.1 MerR family transcriptional regulator [Serpens gallinarum]
MIEFTAAAPRASDPSGQDELFPIREVVRLTGVNPVTLRAWERRYGLIQPVRTEGGHRLYSQADIEAIRSIVTWTERGVAVSKVGSLLERSAANKAESLPVEAEPVAGEWSEWQARIRQAVGDFDDVRLEQLYGQVYSTYPLTVVFEDIVLPLWHELLHRKGFGQASQWLFFDAFLRARVLQRLQLARRPDDNTVLLAAVPDQCRELELLVAGLLLNGDNGAVRVLALGQPLEELSVICQAVQPRALVLYVTAPPTDSLLAQLRKLVLAVDCPLALCGEGSELAHDRLAGTPIARLGSAGRLMQRRLAQFLSGHLNT